MSPRDLAFVGCRLLALYFLYVALLSIPEGLFALSSAFGQSGPQGVQFFYQPALWLVLASPILSLAKVLVLWFGARWLSREVADDAPAAAHTWSPRTLLSVAGVFQGWVFVTFALPRVVLFMLYISNGATRME